MRTEAYIVNLDEYKSIGTRSITLYVNDSSATYFDSFGIEHIPKETKKFNDNKNFIRNIFRMQVYELILCGHFCNRFIDFMFKGKSLTDFANLCLPHNFEKNEKVFLNSFLK